MTELVQKYNVLYVKKSEKKRKIYSDGQLFVSRVANQPTIATVTLKDDEGKDVYKKKGPFQSQVNTGDEVIIGGVYEIQVEGLMDVLTSTNNDSGTVGNVVVDTMEKKKFKLSSGVSGPPLTLPSRPLPSSINSSSSCRVMQLPHQKQSLPSTSTDMSIDSSLLRIMRPHQIEGMNMIFHEMALYSYFAPLSFPCLSSCRCPVSYCQPSWYGRISDGEYHC